MPELTLLCDGPAAHHWHNSNVKTIHGSSKQMQSTASSRVEAVPSSVSESVNSLQIQSSNVTQQTSRQPPMLKKLYQPATATTNGGETVMKPCCHHCTSCQTKLPSNEQNTPYTDKHGASERGWLSVTSATDRFVHSSTPVSVSVQSPVIPDSMQNSISSPDVCAGNLRTPNVSISCAARASVHGQSALPMEPLAAAELIVQPSVAHDCSQHAVESLPSLSVPSHDLPSHSGQLVSSRLRQSGQFHQYSLPHGPHFAHASHQHRAPYAAQGSEPRRYSQSGQLIAQIPVMPTRFVSPSSQQASHVGVHQPSHISPNDSSRLPVKVVCKSQPTADQLDVQCCASHVSTPAAAKVLQCTQLHQPPSVVFIANQHDKLPGSSKAVRFTSQSGTPLVRPAPQCNAPVCQQDVLFDSGQCASLSSSALMNDSQHSECQVDVQSLSSHSVTPAVSMPSTSLPRTVDDLLRSVKVENTGRPAEVPKDFSTVDDFVESVLVHNSASTDSGLQVNDSAGSGDTPPITSSASLAVDTGSSVLHDVGDSVAHSEDDSSQQSVNRMKCRKMSLESETCRHPGYFQDKTKACETTEQFSRSDNRPKLCSVAVNTSLYWPPVDNGSSRNVVASSGALAVQNDAQCLSCFDAGYNYNTAQAAIDMAVRRSSGYARDADSPVVSVSHRQLVGDRDIEHVSDTCDSMADISLRTPPPPVFPSPSEESVVSEMIMDMPEYTALSQEK